MALTKSVSQTLLKPTEKLTIKLSVGLIDSMGVDNYYNLYEAEQYDYLTMNLSASIIFQYKTKEPWDRSHQFHVDDRNIYRFNMVLQEFYQILIRPNLFTYYNDGMISCNSKDEDKRHFSSRNEFIELEAGVIFDTNNDPLPGVLLRINMKDNQVDLSIDEYESIMYKFSKINIGAESMNLIIAKMLMEDRLKKSKKKPSTSKPKANIFEKRAETKEDIVEDHRVVQTKSAESLFDLL